MKCMIACRNCIYLEKLFGYREKFGVRGETRIALVVIIGGDVGEFDVHVGIIGGDVGKIDGHVGIIDVHVVNASF
ncbi:hypothetical protein [Paenisporosarcina sp.]|uniref:hypothetical protein n=1 Tax=Paenisporosarcina sp. TaxID=1932001 RepID=UPI003C75F2B7